MDGSISTPIPASSSAWSRRLNLRKPSEVVHQDDTRIDYAPVKVGDKTMVLPMKTVINTEVVPNGDSQAAGHYTTRRTLFAIEYKDYQAK